MLLSIVIPVFEVESYIARCLDSVLQIGCGDVNIFLVIGDSTDASNAICDDYCARFPQKITVVRQSGSGLSNARNCALGHLNGRYVAYFDGDDYILPEQFQETLRMIRGYEIASVPVDVFVSDYYAVDATGIRLYESGQIPGADVGAAPAAEAEESAGEESAACFFESRRGIWNVWRYVYRRDFLLEEGIVFREGRMSEDMAFTTEVFLRASNVRFCHNPYYCYRINRPNSLMSRVTLKSVADRAEIAAACMCALWESARFRHREAYARHLLLDYILGIVGILEVDARERAAAAQAIQRTAGILDVNYYPAAKLCHILIRLTGTVSLARMLWMLKKARRCARKLKIRGTLLKNGISQKRLCV